MAAGRVNPGNADSVPDGKPARLPAGLDNARGILSTAFFKDPTDPTWKNDAAYKEWLAFMDKYYPDGDKTSNAVIVAYLEAQTLVQVLKQ